MNEEEDEFFVITGEKFFEDMPIEIKKIAELFKKTGEFLEADISIKWMDIDGKMQEKNVCYLIN